MRRSTGLLLWAFGLAAAQSNYPNQSAPFNLVLSSEVNATLNGMKLAACHSGAAIESLCLEDSFNTTDPMWTTFYFNTSATPPSDPNALESGLLTWIFTGGTPTITYSTAMAFIYDTASNLAFPMIWPGEDSSQPVAFTTLQHMAVPASVNDAITPPGPYRTGTTYWGNRWAICRTYYQAYGYTALQWVMGAGEPQNPSCEAVTVEKVWL